MLEAILLSPELYQGPPMVKPPVVQLAGDAARARPLRRHRRLDLALRTGRAGALLAAQRLRLGRQPLARHLADAGPLEHRRLRRSTSISVDAWDDSYSTTETAEEALARALASWGYAGAARRAPGRAARLRPAAPRKLITANWQRGPYRAMRQNALLQLIGVSPDLILQ